MKDIRHRRPHSGAESPPEQGFPALYSDFLENARAGFEIEGGVAPEMMNPCLECPNWRATYVWRGSRRDPKNCANLCAEGRKWKHEKSHLPSVSGVISDICSHFDIPEASHEDKPRYIKHNTWQYCYRDGSVGADGGPELVTGAMRPGEISSNLREAYDFLNSLNVRCSPTQSAGGHITVSGGTLTDVVCANIWQISLYYLPALLALSCSEDTGKRDAKYRDIFQLWEYIEEYHGLPIVGRGDHYDFLNFKPANGSEGIQLVEFRFPDSLPHPHRHQIVAVLCMAIVGRAIYESEKGIIELPEEHETWAVAESNKFIGSGRFREDGRVYALVNELISFLEPELKKLIWLRNLELNLMVFQSRWKKNGRWIVKEGEDMPLPIAEMPKKRVNQYA